VIVGDCMRGLPLGADGDFTRPLGLADLFIPYSILAGLFAVTVFAIHGSIYLYLKTDGDLQERIKGWMWTTLVLFLAAYLVLSAWTLVFALPGSTANFARHRWLWWVPMLNALAIANVPRALYRGKPFDAFFSSSAAIAAFTFLFGVALFPNLISSSEGAAYSLTLSRAARRRCKSRWSSPRWGCRSWWRTPPRSTGCSGAKSRSRQPVTNIVKPPCYAQRPVTDRTPPHGTRVHGNSGKSKE
jgi:cytochrome bd-type quinol oxidase subunit 2